MVTTKLNLSMTEPQVRQIYAKQGDTGRVLDISLDQTPEDGTLRILRPDGVEVTSEAVTGGEISESGETVTFESMTEADVTELTVGIEPVQDLNGYDKPWVGGAGKNKLPNDATSRTINGLTFTKNADGTVVVNGTASALTELILFYDSGNSFPYNGYILTGCPSGYGEKLILRLSDVNVSSVSDRGSGSPIVLSDTGKWRASIIVQSGTTVNNAVFEPMIRANGTDATYAPYSNICPITGHDEVTVTDEGVNLLNYDAWKNVDVVRGTAVWENNGVTLTATSNDCFTNYGVSFPNDAKVEVTEGETITLAWDATPTNIGNVYIFPNGQTSGLVTEHSDVGHLSYTVASGVTYLTFRVGVSNSGVTASYKNIQIVRGTTVPTWTPYVAPNTYTTSLGQTVYGGTLDMVTGVLTVDRAIVDLGTLTWIRESIGDGNRFRTPLAGAEVADYPSHITALCSAYPLIEVGQTATKKQGFTIASNSNVYIYDGAQQSATGTDFKTAVTGTQLVYGLASPLTYTLTPQQIKTLVGTNNVWASSGDIVSIKFTYGGLLSELPSDATSVVGKCYCDVEQNGVSSMPFTLNVKKNERES